MIEFEKDGGAEEPRGRGEDRSPRATRAPASLHLILSAPAVTLAAMWLYRRALTFAYFNDDPTGHFAWMEGRSLLQFFTGAADYGYYRPVVFAVLRVSELIFGNETFPHHPIADHALLVLLHGVNAGLVWAFARRLSGANAFAWVAALAFAFVPFSYEAVGYVASLTHPLMVFWTLVSILLFDRGRSGAVERARLTAEEGNHTVGGRRRLLPANVYLVLAFLALIFGLLTHENGLFIVPALVGLDWVARPRTSIRERARALWPYAVPPVVFVALWLAIPKNSEQGLNSLADIGRNTLPFLQTLVYPLLPLFQLDSSDVGALVLLSAVVVVVSGMLAWLADAMRLWAFALGWFALSALPALLFLGPAYVYGSPRLSYLPAVGVALLWAIPVLNLGKRVPQLAFSALLTAVYILAIVLQPLPFIHCQLDFYDETSRFARGMADSAKSAPAGQEVVFINAPFFFSSTAARPDGCPSSYPWTPVGGILIPPYAQPRDFVRFNGGPDRPVNGVTYAGYGPGWRTFGPEIDGEALRGHAAEDRAYVFDLLDGTFANLPAAWLPGAAAAGQPLATYDSSLALIDAETSAGANQLIVRLDWQVDEVVATPLASFVHVYDAAGALAAQSDGPPGGGLAPQTLWRPGDGLRDERRIDLSALSPGGYRVVVGVYHATGGTRLTAEGRGQPLPDDVFPIGVIER